MSYLTPFNVLIALVGIAVIIGSTAFAAHRFGIVGLETHDLPDDDMQTEEDDDDDYDDDDYDDDDDDYDDDDDDYDDDDDDEPFDTGALNVKLLALRLSKPHLFDTDWYEKSRQDLSHWAVGEAQKQADWIRSMRSAA